MFECRRFEKGKYLRDPRLMITFLNSVAMFSIIE